MNDYTEALIKNLASLSTPRLSSVLITDKLGQLGETLQYARSSFSLASLSKVLRDTKISTGLVSNTQQPQNTPDRPIMHGKLELTIVDARNLSIVDPTRADVYCVLVFQEHVMSTLSQSQSASLSTAPAARGGLEALFGQQLRASSPKWNYSETFEVRSISSDLVVCVYDRGNKLSNGEDRLLGVGKILPRLTPHRTVELCLRLEAGPGSLETQPTTGEVRVQATLTEDVVAGRLTPDDFRVIRRVGHGAFGKVYEVVKRDTNQRYAMKVLSKQLLVQQNEVAHTLSERNVMIQTVSSPFIVSLKFSFQTKDRLFLVMDFFPGGDLFSYLQSHPILSEHHARICIAELVCALEAIHACDVVYRDLKPENILLDANGHVALTDFGLCKELKNSGETATFCGTSEFLAPEMVLQKPYGKAVDWWSLGVLLYHLLVGTVPFQSIHLDVLYRRILRAPLKFPSSVRLSPEARDLITRLMDRNPSTRLGSSGSKQVREHPFFRDVRWDLVAQKRISPLSTPKTSSAAIDIPTHQAGLSAVSVAASSLDPSSASFLQDDARSLSPSVQDAFRGFNYTCDDVISPSSLDDLDLL